MKDKWNQNRLDIFALIGILLWAAYQLVKHIVPEIPDAVAYPWMIISCISMGIGIARCGYKTGKYLTERNSK
ncbi:MAG: hypothetical protein IJW18_00165 [Lachnospiraceae bacterium]|nr:hypothetical protein [Lachnospiraceae bacterium]